MNSKNIKIRGIVQGVGFRPTVYRLASALDLRGFVKNDGQGVFIHIEGDGVDSFLAELLANLPPQARISAFTVDEAPFECFSDFTIYKSEIGSDRPAPIPPDLAICEDCLRELFNPEDRRHNYPFINCTNCGPRYSIIREVPYDRPFTTMAQFEMCPVCHREYDSPEDRRFHAQPNACAVCGPSYSLLNSHGQQIEIADPIRQAAELIESGKIVAMKGIGGFHLLANAFDERVIAELRTRKHRPTKPFAIMVRNLEAARSLCQITEAEARILESPAAPILLLKKSGAIPEAITPNLDRVGIFLPYAPANHLLFKHLSISAIIATSGNRRDEPIVYENDKAVRDLTGIADAFLIHNREIVGRCDDSVGFVFEGEMIFHRRSRGFVPSAIELPFEGSSVLAVGADLKSVFCITRKNEAFLSPYLGDLQSPKASEFFDEVLERYLEWLKVVPEAVVGDMHPDYFSSIAGERLAKRLNVPFYRIQHHYAHALSVACENNLESACAVIFDGHGWAPDGTIWGGEFLAFDHTGFRRLGHLHQVPQIGGDRAALDARRMALSWLYETFGTDALDIFSRLGLTLSIEKDLLERLLVERRPPLTSSVGRLFDTFATISGVCHENTFEGECPQALMAEFDKTISGEYSFTYKEGILDPRVAIDEAAHDILLGVRRAVISTKFHRGLALGAAETASEICSEVQTEDVILSGGVFQNEVLLRLTVEALRAKGLRPFWNRSVSPGDEGIALGQAFLGIQRLSGASGQTS